MATRIEPERLFFINLGSWEDRLQLPQALRPGGESDYEKRGGGVFYGRKPPAPWEPEEEVPSQKQPSLTIPSEADSDKETQKNDINTVNTIPEQKS